MYGAYHSNQVVKWDLNFEFDYQDVRRLMEDIQELKPTLFCAVPRVYDRIYTGSPQHNE